MIIFFFSFDKEVLAPRGGEGKGEIQTSDLRLIKRGS